MRFNSQKHAVKRMYTFCGLSTVLFLLLVVRLFSIQIKEGEELAVSANSQYYYEENTSDLNLKLLDRNNELVFNYEKIYYAVIDPKVFFTMNNESMFKDMRNIAYVLRTYDKDYDLDLLQYDIEKGKKHYAIDSQCYEKLRKIKDVKGIYTYEFMKSNKAKDWNIKNLLINNRKYSNDKELKDEGTLERDLYEYTKNNKVDKIIFEKDVSEKVVNETKVENADNRNVMLTLDNDIQNKAQEILQKEDYKMYPQIGILLMESNTGDILAMAQKDDKLSNVNIGVPSGNGFLIGSVFKTIVYEAALNNSLITKDEIFDIQNIFERRKNNEKASNVSRAYAISSNDIFAQIGWRVGMNVLFEYASKHGLFEKVLNLQDERNGIIEGYGKEHNDYLITNTSIGQTLRVTPIEAISIPNTVINDGVYVKPRIIKEVRENDGDVINTYKTESKRIFNIDLAKHMKNEMINVVENHEGTGKKAKLEGIEIGGKTGTTEYFIGDKEASDGWFCGFFQYNNKYYSMVVFIPEINLVNDAGGGTACIIFRDLVENIINMKYLK